MVPSDAWMRPAPCVTAPVISPTVAMSLASFCVRSPSILAVTISHPSCVTLAAIFSVAVILPSPFWVKVDAVIAVAAISPPFCVSAVFEASSEVALTVPLSSASDFSVTVPPAIVPAVWVMPLLPASRVISPKPPLALTSFSIVSAPAVVTETLPLSATNPEMPLTSPIVSALPLSMVMLPPSPVALIAMVETSVLC